MPDGTITASYERSVASSMSSKRLVDLERHLPLVAGERQPLLPPEPREEVHLGALLGEAAGVVPDLRLVVVGLHQDGDLLAFEAHWLAPMPVATAARCRPCVVLSKSAQRSAIMTIPAWQLPDGTAGITLASAIAQALDAVHAQLGIDDGELVEAHAARAGLVVVRVGLAA